MQTKHIVILGTVAALAIAGVTWAKKQLKLLTQMTYKVRDLRLNPQTDGKIRLDFNLELTNPSAVSVKISRYDLSVYGNEQYISKVISAPGAKIEIPAGGQTLVPLSLTFLPKEVGDTLINLALDTVRDKQFKIRVKGELTAAVGKGLPIGRTLPVDYSNNLLKDGKSNGGGKS